MRRLRLSVVRSIARRLDVVAVGRGGGLAPDEQMTVHLAAQSGVWSLPSQVTASLTAHVVWDVQAAVSQQAVAALR